MLSFVYPAVMEPGEEAGFVVTFPDVPEAITEGDDEIHAQAMASEALALALLAYVQQDRPLPSPSALRPDTMLIAVPPDDACKLAVIHTFKQSGLSKSELARRLGKDEREVRRLLDPMHATKLPALTAALTALGRRLVVGVEAIGPAAPFPAKPARAGIRDKDVIRLSAKNSRVFAATVIDPPEPSPGLKRAGEQYRKRYVRGA